jgi:hypothetical protein
MLNLPSFLIGSNLVFGQFFDFFGGIESIGEIIMFNRNQAIGCNLLNQFSNKFYKKLFAKQYSTQFQSLGTQPAIVIVLSQTFLNYSFASICNCRFDNLKIEALL